MELLKLLPFVQKLLFVLWILYVLKSTPFFYGKSKNKIPQCASSQFSPTPNSASTGTSLGSFNAFFIDSKMMGFMSSTSDLSASNTNSSCTCKIIFDLKLYF